MASVDDLKALISSRGGIARTNQFLIQIPAVSSLSLPRIPIFENLGLQFNIPNVGTRTTDSPTSSELNILCKAAQIPGKQILTRPRDVGMQPETVAYGYGVVDATMTFHLLNDYGVLKFFEAWKSSVVNEDAGEVAYKVNYQRDVKIHQLKRPITNKELSSGPVSLDVTTNFVHAVVLENAFPSTIQTVELTNDLDAIGELTVQLDYSNVKTIGSTPLGSIDFTINTPFGILGTSIGL